MTSSQLKTEAKIKDAASQNCWFCQIFFSPLHGHAFLFVPTQKQRTQDWGMAPFFKHNLDALPLEIAARPTRRSHFVRKSFYLKAPNGGTRRKVCLNEELKLRSRARTR